MENEKKGRGRPKLPRDEYGNIIRPGNEVRPNEPVGNTPLPAPVNETPAEWADIGRYERRNGIDCYQYDSVAQFVESALGPCRNPANITYQQGQSLTTERSATWMGMPYRCTGNDVLAYIKDGWSDGAAKMETLTEGLKLPEVKSSRRVSVWSDNGHEVEMQRVWSGQFDQAFRTSKRVSSRQPRTFRICINVCGNANVSGDELFWRGAAAIVLADIISRSGNGVEIVNVQGAKNYNDSDKLLAFTTVKEAFSPLDINAIAATSALAGFFRSAGFAWDCSHYRTETNSGLGKAMQPTLDMLERDDVQATYFAHEGITSRDEARGWIETALADFA